MAAPDADPAGSSYYAVLNVPRDASVEEIKRAYRQLASVFHPDKHTSEELRGQAQEAFARLQEAYEVLSDPHRRDVYDAYGSEGLSAGLEVGSKLQSVEERRAQWRAFLDDQERKRQDAMTNHRGHYLCRLDATAIAHGAARAPSARMIMASNAVDIPIDVGGGGDGGVVTVQGQALLRTHPRVQGTMLGSGSVVAGYRRQIGSSDSVEGSLQLGLNSLLSLTSTRQVDHYTQAALAATYNWEQGLGLQVISTRQLWRTTTADFRWIVGPQPGGVALGVAHRGSNWAGSGRVELSGGAASLALRGVWDATAATQLRGTLRLTAMGPDVEVGAEHKFNTTTAAYLGTQVGLRSGVLLRVRCRRSKQTFEFPILLSTDAREWQLFAASALLPPLASLALHRLVVRPLVRWRRAAAARAALQEQAEALRAEHRKAAREAALLVTVARRRAVAEVVIDGLIVLEAIYGDLEAWREAMARGEAGASEEAFGLFGIPPPPPPPPPPQPQQQQRGEEQQPQGGDGGGSGRPGGGGQQQEGAGGGGGAKGEEAALPSPWLDVTAALQYLVSGGTLELYPGVSKRGLMGFADVVPEGGEKLLLVRYYFNGQIFEARVGDMDMLRLPAAGQAVRDAALAERLRARLSAVAAAAAGNNGSAGGARGGSDGGSGASSRRGSSSVLGAGRGSGVWDRG